ncbi:hypothetical protein [Telmatospirillum sp. J64-1]|uniref:hypothetical protein n=1 Tax=Telmatospirillum sp. J64-1 TaxID=2502183 RepID=UPI00115DD743|nr:hypothetical protein [Telmatospirillum sp. J64-1]
MDQQEDCPFVARLKPSSEYAHQTKPGVWFPVTFRYRYDDFFINGNQNTYRLKDVHLGVLLPDGKVLKL